MSSAVKPSRAARPAAAEHSTVPSAIQQTATHEPKKRPWAHTQMIHMFDLPYMQCATSATQCQSTTTQGRNTIIQIMAESNYIKCKRAAANSAGQGRPKCRETGGKGPTQCQHTADLSDLDGHVLEAVGAILVGAAFIAQRGKASACGTTPLLNTLPQKNRDNQPGE
jgi:hypothetical protein